MKRRRKHRPTPKSAAGAVVLIIVIVLLVIAAAKVDRAVRPAAVMQAEHIAKMRASEAIGSAVSEYISGEDFSYSDLAAVLYDSSGRAASVEALPVSINRVQSELTVLINDRLERSSDEYAEIALGSLTGSYLLAGKGPRLRIRICPAANAQVELRSSFDSAGLNQTRHRIFAVVTADIASSLPIYSYSSTVSFEFLLAESVIVGDVPDISRYAWNEL